MEDDGAQKADCILVLGGDGFGCRIVKAGQLAEQGYAPYVLVDGPRMLMGHETDQTIAYAVGKGFPASLFRAVPLPNPIDSTSEESEYVANNVLRPQHVHKVLLVTSNYHTRRAARILRRAAPWLAVDVVPAPDPYFKFDGWWKTRDGKKTFLFEWMKTISEWWGD
ncbi:MAG TPA: YdcF family protein [Bryobacteraceae bacterium]|nr:YdcF family protein [Bryobacteraceae bacterium]